MSAYRVHRSTLAGSIKSRGIRNHTPRGKMGKGLPIYQRWKGRFQCTVALEDIGAGGKMSRKTPKGDEDGVYVYYF